jgi:hypothetical protein
MVKYKKLEYKKISYTQLLETRCNYDILFNGRCDEIFKIDSFLKGHMCSQERTKIATKVVSNELITEFGMCYSNEPI